MPFGQPPHLFGGAYPNPPQGHLVKVSTLREDGFAAALSWRYCTLAPIPQKHEMFLQKYKGSREIISLVGFGVKPQKGF